MTVLISGAGLTGLTLALTLHDLGVPFRVFEAVREIRPLGVGINLQPHAVRELTEMGHVDRLSACGIETEEVAYFDAHGALIWREPRGRRAGYGWPQYSVHRGKLQMMLLEALEERAPGRVTAGAAITDWKDGADGVAVQLTDRAIGERVGTAEGAVLVACDGINSAARAKLRPEEGAAKWGGCMMWRGTTRGLAFLTGASVTMTGTKWTKFVAYPIEDHGDGTQTINWIADRRFGPNHDWRRQDWNRQGDLADFLPAFEGWSFDWLDIPATIRAADQVLEYPMVDRDPLDRWTDGRITLAGDAAHAMYPIGSNGASQGIIDARVLGRELAKGVGTAALRAYEAERRDAVNGLVLANRGDGPDRILDIVAERAPKGFAEIEDVMPLAERQALADSYKAKAGMDIAALNARAPLVPVRQGA